MGRSSMGDAAAKPHARKRAAARGGGRGGGQSPHPALWGRLPSSCSCSRRGKLKPRGARLPHTCLSACLLARSRPIHVPCRPDVPSSPPPSHTRATHSHTLCLPSCRRPRQGGGRRCPLRSLLLRSCRVRMRARERERERERESVCVCVCVRERVCVCV